MMLFLRWMIRPADGVDLGLWPLPTRILVCPVDTHIHKLARNLGFTKRTDTSFRTALEITAALALFDPEDPVKYDFALCHLGMAQRCPSRRDPLRCQGCGVLPVCRHWTGRDRRASGAVRLLLTSAPR
jgi:endonuclease III